MKRTLTITLIATLYTLIALFAVWWSIGESVDCQAFADTVRPSQACGVE